MNQKSKSYTYRGVDFAIQRNTRDSIEVHHGKRHVMVDLTVDNVFVLPYVRTTRQYRNVNQAIDAACDELLKFKKYDDKRQGLRSSIISFWENLNG